MKAITVWQPWATLLATGQKHNETRSWKTSYRGEILIHAAKTDHSGILLHIPMEELKHFQDAEFQCFNESAEGFAIETAYDDGKDCEEWEER